MPWEFEGLGTILGLVARGVGIAAVPSLALTAAVPGIAARELPGSLTRYVYAVVRTASVRRPSVKVTLEALRDAVAEIDVQSVGRTAGRVEEDTADEGAERHWRRRRLTPAIYDFAVEHEALARLGGRVLWGADVRPLYAAFGETGRLPPGGAVLDVPCGGGVAFRGVPRGAGLRYVAADLSAFMLGRARAEAAPPGARGGVRAGERRTGCRSRPGPSTCA